MARSGQLFEAIPGATHIDEHIKMGNGKIVSTVDEFDYYVKSLGEEEPDWETTEQRVLFGLNAFPSHGLKPIFLFRDNVLDVVRTPENLRREKTSTLHEMSEERDDIEDRMEVLATHKMYPGYPFGREYGPLGSPESVSSITLEDLARHHEIYYQPGNLSFYKAGNFDVQETIDELARQFGDLVPGNMDGIQAPIPLYEQEKNRVFIETRKSEQVHLRLAFHFNHTRDRAQVHELVLLSRILDDNVNRQIASKLTIGYSAGFACDLFQDFGMVYADVAVAPQYVDLALDTIVSELNNPNSTERSFEADKTAYLGQTLLDLDSPESVVTYMADQFGSFGYFTAPQEHFGAVKSFTVNTIKERAKKTFRNNRAALIIIGPVDPGREDELEAKLQFSEPATQPSIEIAKLPLLVSATANANLRLNMRP
jgi:predicted Zn-dependent peptidase